MNNPLSAERRQLAVHGSGISALALVHHWEAQSTSNEGKLPTELLVVVPTAQIGREMASQHAQCVLHRGYFYAAKVANGKVKPRIASQLLEASLLWEEVRRDVDFEYEHGMVWLVVNEDARDNVESEFQILSEMLSAFRSTIAEEVKRLFEAKRIGINNPAVLPGTIKTLSNLNLNRPSVTAYEVDQWVVRPCDVLQRLMKGRKSVAESALSEAAMNSISLKAVGRSVFGQVTNQHVPTRDHWVILAKGRLPHVNALVYRVFENQHRSGQFCSLLIVSHRTSDDEIVWQIDSQAFDVRQGQQEQRPSCENFQLTVEAILANIRVTEEALQQANWYAYRAKLPEFSEADADAVDRSIAEVGNQLYLYTYRFTLAPLIAQHAAALVDTRSPRAFFPEQLSNSVGPVDLPADFWDDRAREFSTFADFQGSLV